MIPTKIKLCGMTRPADIEAANELMPDYIGFVFAPKSKRHVTAAQAKELKALLAPSIKAVGVFVNESPSVIVQLAKGGILDAVQLHGNEDASYIADLRNHLDIPILQAFRIRTAEDAGIAQGSTADSVLLDAGAGTGTVFDWSLIASVAHPYFLAGGLTPENVADAILALHPHGVDVSSGIETDGRKDKKKMAAFVAAVRNVYLGKETRNDT